MGIFSRLTDIVNSNINALLDRAEEPEKIIRLIIQEMEDTLVEVRSDTVRIIADRKEAERHLARLSAENEDWQAKAELALSKGRDDLARAALVAKTRVTEAIKAEEQRLADINEGLERQGEDIARLQAKLDDARKREASMIARQRSAATRLQARSIIWRARSRSMTMAASRAWRRRSPRFRPTMRSMRSWRSSRRSCPIRATADQ